MTEIPLVPASSTKTKPKQQKKRIKKSWSANIHSSAVKTHTHKKRERYDKLDLLLHLTRGLFSLHLNTPSFSASQLELAFRRVALQHKSLGLSDASCFIFELVTSLTKAQSLLKSMC